MPDKVVDASVMSAWCFGESRVLEAANVLRDNELYAPILMAYELTNIARRKITVNPEKEDIIVGALEMVLALPIHWSEVDFFATLGLSLDFKLTAYDASYLYLARKLGIPLATFDQKLAQAAQN